MFRHVAAAAAASLLTLVPAHAQTRAGMTPSPAMAPDSGYSRIRAGSLPKAEAELLEARAKHPEAPEVALNLAAVYVMTGRGELAAPLYREVLAAKPVAMDMPSGTVVSSHDVARNGAVRINAQYAAR